MLGLSWALPWIQVVNTNFHALNRGPKYDMDAYKATLYGGEAWDFCWELGQAKKLDLTLNTSPANIRE